MKKQATLGDLYFFYFMMAGIVTAEHLLISFTAMSVGVIVWLLK